MARLPYANADAPAIRDLVQRIVRERGEVLHLYRMLLHSPTVAKGWLGFMTAIRQQTTLPPVVREFIVIRIAVLNRASYEADQHKPIAVKEGATREQIEALAQWDQHTALYSAQERAALALADEMTRTIQITDATWATVAALWTPEEIVELVATIASYNMVSRFLEALNIHSDDSPQPQGAGSE